ncbi:MAG: hypothetical protein AAF742_04050 [Pseudomonadota bacterium]
MDADADQVRHSRPSPPQLDSEAQMDLKEAVKRAKSYADDLFERDVTLEEVWFDDKDRLWCVTIGLARNRPDNLLGSVRQVMGDRHDFLIHYKTIRLHENGDFHSIKNHEKMPVSPL